MKVRACGFTGIAYICDDFASFYDITFFYLYSLAVGIEGGEAVSMIDLQC